MAAEPKAPDAAGVNKPRGSKRPVAALSSAGVGPAAAKKSKGNGTPAAVETDKGNDTGTGRGKSRLGKVMRARVQGLCFSKGAGRARTPRAARPGGQAPIWASTAHGPRPHIVCRRDGAAHRDRGGADGRRRGRDRGGGDGERRRG
mmetsp:Transcript_13447/g.31521  ORF Transcript_13447/g.31521 Transcript_13447/m.31521 type:complete len:146 (-) Transcript_13447:1521-1958(-)